VDTAVSAAGNLPAHGVVVLVIVPGTTDRVSMRRLPVIKEARADRRQNLAVAAVEWAGLVAITAPLERSGTVFNSVSLLRTKGRKGQEKYAAQAQQQEVDKLSIHYISLRNGVWLKTG
jgi:hypothetical protein